MTQFYTTSTTIRQHTKKIQGGSCAGPFTTLADGIPRALCTPIASPTITMDLGDEWASISSMTASASITQYPYTRPNCEIDVGACAGL